MVFGLPVRNDKRDPSTSFFDVLEFEPSTDIDSFDPLRSVRCAVEYV
jgi:hypothetical protein